MIIQFDVPGDIVPWARAGGRGSFRFTPKPQRNFMAMIRQLAADAMAGRPLIDGPCELTITATWLWPKSISPKKRARPGANLKTTRPDASNVAKIVEDAINAIVWTDDARVSDTHIYKRLGDRPGLSVTIRTLTEAPARPRDLSGFPDIILPSQHMAEA